MTELSEWKAWNAAVIESAEFCRDAGGYAMSAEPRGWSGSVRVVG